MKEIPHIFDEAELEIALEIINGLEDNKNILFQADIIERAYGYGWCKSENKQKFTKQEERKKKSNNKKLFALDSEDIYLLVMSCLMLAGMLSFLGMYLSCSDSNSANSIKDYIKIEQCQQK